VHGPEFWLRAFEIRPEHALSDLMAAGIRVGGWQARMLQGVVAEPRWHRDWLLELQRKGLDVARTLIPELGGGRAQHPAAEPAVDPRPRRLAAASPSSAEDQRRALVFGATGHIGSAVVRELLERGWQVTATSRRTIPPENLAGLPIRFQTAHGDIPGDFDHWVAGHDLVVDAAAPYPVHLFVSQEQSERQPVDHAVRRTRALLDAVRRHGARLAYIGSFTTTPRRFGPLLGWQSRILRRLHPYFEVKKRMEDQILAASRDGLPVVVVNPTVCIGPWDLKRREHCLIPQLLSGEVPGFVRHPLNVIDVRDVAAVVLAALDTGSYGDPIPLSGHNVSTDSLVQRICELGRGPAPPRLRFPAGLTLAAALSTEALLGLAGRQSPSPALATMLLAESHWTSPEGIQNALGIWPRPLSRTLVDAIDWYRQLGYC
jgi:dihydroflavonol-4-reductase